jgi:hypothetical protein
LALIASIASVALACSACCSPQSRSWQGVLSYSLDAPGDAPVAGSSNVTVTSHGFDPYNQTDTCHPQTFTLTLGPSCSLPANVGGVDFGYGTSDTATGAIPYGELCTLDGTALYVTGGTIAVSGDTLDVDIAVQDGLIQFQGNET